jgi:hypothetical protein
MPRSRNETAAEAGPARGARFLRRANAQIRLAESQMILARATEKNAHYLLWSVILACVSLGIAAAAAVLGVAYMLAHSPH